MTKKKVMLVFGTRPEAIKMAPLVHRLKSKSEIFDVQVCVTAQHRQMLDQVLDIFGIVPDIDLDVMRPGQDLANITANIIQRMGSVLKESAPNALLVHGDTTTTVAAAVAGFYSGVPVGHVEAGLRTHDLSAPFPEEFNRQITSKVARWHFAPTERARDNLIAERIDPATITVTGNTVIDSLPWALRRIETDTERANKLIHSLNEQLSFDWLSTRFVLITGHRRENLGNGFLEICGAIRELATKFTSIYFVYPVHLNPAVGDPVRRMLAGLSNVQLIDPLDYESFIYLLKHCNLVLTDSGGIQEEAPSLGKPVLVMRETTERQEAAEAGTVKLVGACRERIVAGVSQLLEDDINYWKMAKSHNPYGDGKASDRIVSVLKNI